MWVPLVRSCRSIFDIDGIDLGPERRTYLEHKLERVWEINSQGSIPYVPYLRAPYYVWIGRKPTGGVVTHEAKAEAPALFPPTFLYSQSWEDPAPDMKVMNITDKDVCLTLTSGGCNSLNLVRRAPSSSHWRVLEQGCIYLLALRPYRSCHPCTPMHCTILQDCWCCCGPPVVSISSL